MRPIPLAAGQPEHERIECRKGGANVEPIPLRPEAMGPCEMIRCDDCGMLIAKRWQDGSLHIVVKGERYLADGRVALHCPNCDKSIRLNPLRRKAS